MSKINKKFQKPKNSLKVIKRILSYFKDFKIQLFVVIFCIIITSLSRVIGNGSIKIIVDNFIVPLTKDYNSILLEKFIYTLIIIGCIFLFGVFSSYLYTKIMITIFSNILCKIRIDLFNKMEKLPIKYFDNKKHGEIMSLYTNDVETMRAVLTQSLPEFLFSIISITGITSMMFYYSWKLALIVIMLSSFMFVFGKKISKKVGENFKEQQKILGEVNGFIEEIIEGQKVVKVFCYENKAKLNFDIINKKLCEVSTKAHTYANMVMPATIGISTFNYSTTVIIGSIWVVLGTLSLGTLLSFVQYVRSIMHPINSISQQFSNILTALAGAERIFEVMDEKPEIDEGGVVLVNIREENNRVIETQEKTEKFAWKIKHNNKYEYIKLEGNIEFNNVVFKYNEEKTTLNSINFKANKGKKIALVGSTGAGKTTITNLINRFYDIQEGEITIDGINIKNIKKDDLRKNISIVLQDTHLFTENILNNIRYGNLEATDEEVINACKIANADDFIKHLPDGYNTILNSDAKNLSQGERQLLAIARAIVANSPILILDEATSSIDTRTEKLIENAMEKLMRGRTVFVIAHRLSTVRNADSIIVIEKGEILENGNHRELLDRKGKYYQLYNGVVELD